MFFEPIKSKAKLSPNYYEAPDYKNVTSLFTYIENANDLKASNPEAFEVALQQHNQVGGAPGKGLAWVLCRHGARQRIRPSPPV